LTQVEGYLLAGYAGIDEPTKPLHLVPGALDDARRYLADVPDTAARLRKVAELVEGFESPVGLELLASVAWVATNEGANSADAARAALHAWSERKRRFTPEQIQKAWAALAARGLIPQT
jgi:hypothetical protein